MAEKKITETGPKSFLDLQQLNKQMQEGVLGVSDLSNINPIYTPLRAIDSIYEGYEQSPIYQLTGGLDYWGNSAWDELNLTEDLWETLQQNPNEFRAENQAWWSKLGSGIIKGAGLAGTTFLDGIGLVFGAGSALANQDAGELFNNKFSKTLRSFNNYMEELLPVYRTQDEINNPMALRNLTSLSTIADDFIKNVGFAVGAFYSGNAYLKALLAANKLMKAGQISSTAAKVIGSTISGINEGRVEAGNLYDEMYKNGELSLKETYKPLYDQIMAEPDELIMDPETGMAISSRQLKLDQLDKRLEKEKQNLNLRATNAGCMDLIFNSAYLPFMDYLTYGKLYARGFNAKRDLANKVGKEAASSIDNIAEQAVKEGIFGNRVAKNILGKYVANPVSKGKSALKGARIFLTEGSEEMNQALFQSLSTNYYTPDSPDAYYQALTNDDYEANTKDFLTSLTQGIVDSWGNPTAYKEFLIGGLNGIMGMPTFGKVNNSDHNTWLGRGKVLGMSGGMFGEMSNDAYYNQLAQESVNSMNDFIDKVNNSKMFFTRSQSFTNAMDGYSEENDKFEFENAKDNDLFNVIDAYGRTGRILDLYDLVNQDFEDLSEERLKEIAEDTQSDTNEWKNVDGTLMSDSEEGRAQMTLKLLERRDAIIDGIKSYEKSLQNVRSIANNSLTEDLNAELAWLSWKQDRFTDRFNSIKDKLKNFIDLLSHATQQFLDNSSNILTLKEEDATPNATAEQKQEEVKAGKGILKSMQTVSKFLDIIDNIKSPVQLSYFLKDNPKITQYLDDIGYEMLEEYTPITYDEYKQGMSSLKDITKIATAHKTFNDRYKEFTDNPSKLIQNRLKIEQNNQKVNEVKNRNDVANAIKDATVGDLARLASEGNLDFDSILEKMLGGELSLDGNSTTDNVYKDEIEKVKDAQTFKLTRDDLINSITNDDGLTHQEMQDALLLINTSFDTANDVDELLDLDTEVYNDARNLSIADNEIPEDINDRLNQARNVIRQHSDMLEQEAEALKNMPSTSDIPVNPTDRGTTKGRDPLDIAETELERIAKQKEVEEKTKLRELLKTAKDLTWNVLTTQMFGVSGLPSTIKQALDSNIRPLVEDSIQKGLSDTLLVSVLNNNELFRELNTNSNGALLLSILDYKHSVEHPESVQNSLQEVSNGIQSENVESDDRGPVTPAIDNITLDNSQINDGTNNRGISKVNGKYYYLRPSAYETVPNRDGESVNWEDTDEAKKVYPESVLKRMQEVRKKLLEEKAFDKINKDVKVGNKISFVVYPEVNEKTGDIVIFMLTDKGIVGDLAGKQYRSVKDYAGLPKLISDIELAYREWKKEHPTEPFIYKEFEPKITQILVGKVLYTRNLKTLNDIFGDNLKLALCLTQDGLPLMLFDGGKTRKNRSKNDDAVMLPRKPVSGMPYVLVETSDSNRKYFPVSFIMPRYDGSTNTLLGKAIRNVINNIITKSNTSGLLNLKADLLDLLALLDTWISIDNDKLTFRIKKQGAINFETVVSEVPVDTEGLEQKLLNSLVGTPYLVSRKYINQSFDIIEDGEITSVPYNRMIGEIAVTNVGNTRTLDDWFITEPAEGIVMTIPNTGINNNSKNTSVNINFQGTSYTLIKTDNDGIDKWIIKDNKGNIIEDDNIRAYAYGTYKTYDMTKPYTVDWTVEIDVNGVKVKTNIYSPKTNKYIANLQSIPDVDFSMFDTLDAAIAEANLHGVNLFGKPISSLGILKRDRELAEARRDDLRHIRETRALYDINPFTAEDYANLENVENVSNNETLEAINNALLSELAQLKEDIGKSIPLELAKDGGLIFRRNPSAARINLGIIQAVVEDRRELVEHNVIDLLNQASQNGELPTGTEVNTTSEDAFNSLFELTNSIPRQTVVDTEIPYKVGDVFTGMGLTWKIQSINDDGSITLNEVTIGTPLKVKSLTDLLNTFKEATEEDAEAAILKVNDAFTQDVTPEEVLNAVLQISPNVLKVLNNFSGYFEGGGVTIDDHFPNFNEELASKLEDYLFGLGEFTEDDAIEFLNEVARRSKAKDTGLVEANPELDELSPAEIKEKAEKLGLLSNDKRSKLWDNLTSTALDILLSIPNAESKMTMLEASYSIALNKFNLKMLGNSSSIEEFLESKPKYSVVSDTTEELWDEKKELAWLGKALPLFTKENRVLIVEALKTVDGLDAYGQFWNNIITISKSAVRGTVYHEAFHGVVNSLLSQLEYLDLFDAAIEKYGNLPELELEENLAEDFRRYMKLQEVPVIGKLVEIFRKLKHFILKLVGSEPYINKLFYNISQSKYADRGLKPLELVKYSIHHTVAQLQEIVDININSAYPLNTYSLYTLKSSLIKRNAAWGRWKDDYEKRFGVIIKGYCNKNGRWIVVSVAPRAKYLLTPYAKEMQEIREQAIKDGNIVLNKDGSFNYAKAPNSKKSNLNELQWLQVRTKAFKDWFGDWENDPANASKVIDENGEPLVVYHKSTAEGFTIFNLDKSNKPKERLNSYTFHFGTKQAALEVDTDGINGDIFEVFLNIKNPDRLGDDIQADAHATLRHFLSPIFKGRYGKVLSEELFNKARNTLNDFSSTPEDKRKIMAKVFSYMGRDGVRYRNEIEDKGSISYAVLNPNQIKSATDNEGPFSKKEDNIYDSDNIAIEQRGRDMFNFEFLTEEDLLFVKDRVGIEEYNKMSLNQKEVLLHCK